MTLVALIRPGSTDYDDQHRIQGTLDVPLNWRGTEEVRRMAEELRELGISVLYCGMGESAIRTAEAIQQVLDVPVRRLEKLLNLNHGLWQGLQEEEVRRKHPRTYRQWRESPLTVCPPGGETVPDAYQRIRAVLRPVLKRHRHDVIGLVVPEPIASVIYCYLSHQDLARLWERNGSGGRWQTVEVAEEALQRSRRA